jgi:hypothetical protein
MRKLMTGVGALAATMMLGVAWAQPKPDAKPMDAKPADAGKAAGKAAEPAKVAGATDDPAKKVDFPKNYRDWKHVKSMVIFSDKHPLFDAFGGIHHIYANPKAMKGLTSPSHKFPDGAAFAFDLKEAKESTGAYVEGNRKFVATMVKDSKKYAETEGWGWQAWEGGDIKKPVLKSHHDQKVCATCHKDVNSKGFVFTEYVP